MAKILKANILNWFKTKLNSSDSNIQMNGTKSAGTSELVARADHVHQTDTSRAASSHTHGNITNDGAIGSTANLPVITTTSGKLTTGSFGTAANTFCQGNDSRLSNARTPTSHAHGNITNDGKVGSTANVPLITGTGGVVQAGSFGTAANTFCQGNDSRLSNARTPVFNNINPSSTATKNLNDYKTGGFYYISNDSVAQYVSNCPLSGTSNKSFFLLVETWGTTSTYVKQTLTYYNTNITYTRTCTNNTWSAWTALIKEGDSRLSNARAPTSHVHGNITNDGKVGTAANVPLITGTNGVVQAGSFGTAANTFCQGNDSRLSNARTPTSHASTATTYGIGTTANYGHVKTINGLTQASHADGTALSAYQGKVLNDKIINITDGNGATNSYTSLQNSWTGTVKYYVKNGWCIVTFEDLQKASTTSSYDNIISIPYDNAFNGNIYDNSNLNNSATGVMVRVNSSGYLQARCLTANNRKYGYIIYPIIN